MVDYSRFAHIGSDSEDEDMSKAAPPSPSPTTAAATNTTMGATSSPGAETASGGVSSSAARGVGGGEDGSSIAQPMVMQASKKGKEGRIKFEYQGRTIYEWEQSLDEVNMYIQPPPGLQASQVECKITSRHLRLGIKGNPPFIDEDTGGPVVVEESYWMMEGGELNVNLQKVRKAETWAGALQGHNASVDPVTLEGMQKKIMLERFQNENPGFDFSGAEFNGQVPDARTFMGGVKYT